MSADATTDGELADVESLTDDVRRLGLVMALALAGLAVLGLAWTATPAGAAPTSAAALATGAAGILALTTVALAASHRRTNQRLREHTQVIDAVRGALDGSATPSASGGSEVRSRVEDLEGRLRKVEQIQTEHLVELIDSTDPPQPGQTATNQG